MLTAQQLVEIRYNAALYGAPDSWIADDEIQFLARRLGAVTAGVYDSAYDNDLSIRVLERVLGKGVAGERAASMRELILELRRDGLAAIARPVASPLPSAVDTAAREAAADALEDIQQHEAADNPHNIPEPDLSDYALASALAQEIMNRAGGDRELASNLAQEVLDRAAGDQAVRALIEAVRQVTDATGVPDGRVLTTANGGYGWDTIGEQQIAAAIVAYLQANPISGVSQQQLDEAVATLNTAIGLRVLQSAYDAAIRQINADIGARVLQSAYDAFVNTVITALGNSALQTDLDAEVARRVSGDMVDYAQITTPEMLTTVLNAHVSTGQTTWLYFAAEVVHSGTTYAERLVAVIEPSTRNIRGLFLLPAGGGGGGGGADTAARARLDVIEASGWVTARRIGAGELRVSHFPGTTQETSPTVQSKDIFRNAILSRHIPANQINNGHMDDAAIGEPELTAGVRGQLFNAAASARVTTAQNRADAAYALAESKQGTLTQAQLIDLLQFDVVPSVITGYTTAGQAADWLTDWRIWVSGGDTVGDVWMEMQAEGQSLLAAPAPTAPGASLNRHKLSATNIYNFTLQTAQRDNLLTGRTTRRQGRDIEIDLRFHDAASGGNVIDVKTIAVDWLPAIGLGQTAVDARIAAVPGLLTTDRTIASYDATQNRFETSGGNAVRLRAGVLYVVTQAIYDAAVADSFPFPAGVYFRTPA